MVTYAVARKPYKEAIFSSQAAVVPPSEVNTREYVSMEDEDDTILGERRSWAVIYFC